MKSKKTDATPVMQSLMWVCMPIKENSPPERILVLAVGMAEQSTRLILCDLDNKISQRMIIGQNIPAEYDPSLVDRLAPFLESHESLREQIVAEGAAWHGPLTLARAIQFASDTGATPEIALAMAKKLSEECRDYCIRLHAEARPVIDT